MQKTHFSAHRYNQNKIELRNHFTIFFVSETVFSCFSIAIKSVAKVVFLSLQKCQKEHHFYPLAPM